LYKPQKLTLAGVKREGRKALQAGTLSIFSKEPACVYTTEDGCHCVIGASFTPETLGAVKEHDGNLSRIYVLRDKGIVDYDRRVEQSISALQCYHDSVCSLAVDYLKWGGLRSAMTAESLNRAYEHFCLLLGIKTGDLAFIPSPTLHHNGQGA